MKINNRNTIITYWVLLAVVIFIGWQFYAQDKWLQVENARMAQEKAELMYSQNN